MVIGTLVGETAHRHPLPNPPPSRGREAVWPMTSLERNLATNPLPLEGGRVASAVGVVRRRTDEDSSARGGGGGTPFRLLYGKN